MGWRATGVVAASLVAACSLSPDYAGTHYQCDDDHRCPDALACIEGLCQDSPVDRIDASALDAPLDASTSAACGGGQLIFAERFDADALDDQVWSVSTDNATAGVVGDRLEIEPLGAGGTATVTTDDAFQLDGTRITIEVLPLDDITSSGTSVALVEPGTSTEVAAFLRDTFDFEVQTAEVTFEQVEYDTFDHRFWRFELEGGAIRFYTSRDGDVFELLATDPAASFPVEAELSIWVQNYAGTNEPNRFDSITWCTLD